MNPRKKSTDVILPWAGSSGVLVSDDIIQVFGGLIRVIQK